MIQGGITFTGGVTDAGDGKVRTSLSWSSNQGGTIVTGESFAKSSPFMFMGRQSLI